MRATFTVLFLITIAGIAACEKSAHQLVMITPLSPVDREIVEEVGDVFQGNEHIQVRLTDTPMAEAAAVEAVAAGKADLALVSNNLPFHDEIATVMPLYPSVLHIARRKGALLVEAPEMFRNARVYAGPEGSASRLVFERIAKRFGISAAEYRYVIDMADDPDIFVVLAPISPERIAELPGYVLYSMAPVQSIGQGGVVDTAVLLNPQFRPFVIPVGTYAGATPEPISTIAVDKMLVTRRDLDSAVVYDLINEVVRLRPALAERRGGLFRELSEDIDTSHSTFVVHAGTQSYLQRTAPSIYERYSGVAEVVVTLIVALSSAIFAAIRFYRMRRKDRIDKFYSRTIELGRSVTAATQAAERQRVIDEVRALQATAFDMLVDEKLAADESFRIFITLSNDVQRELAAYSGDMRSTDG